MIFLFLPGNTEPTPVVHGKRGCWEKKIIFVRTGKIDHVLRQSQNKILYQTA